MLQGPQGAALFLPFLSFTGVSQRLAAEVGRASICLETPGQTTITALQKDLTLSGASGTVRVLTFSQAKDPQSRKLS